MKKAEQWTTEKIRKTKGNRRLACLTATDTAFAQLLDQAGIPLILVGDSLGMTVLGYANTLPVTMDEMLHHAAAVARGVKHALVVADLPFLSFQVSDESALVNAGRFLKEAGVRAVKLEGGVLREDLVRSLVANGIPVLGHIGLLPQRVHAMGGYKVQGRGSKNGDQLLDDAMAMDRAGAFAVVLEGIPAALARTITQTISIPTIGIGAGPDCDGQILVLHDVIGMTPDPAPRFVRRFAHVGRTVKRAAVSYRTAVETGQFPAEKESY